MKRTLATAAAACVLTIGLAGCGASTDPNTGDALPQGSSTSKSTDKATDEPAADDATTCDKAREAILTGTPKEIKAALTALQKDKTADATAREYARYYLGRDKNDKDLQEMDISLIQTACSI